MRDTAPGTDRDVRSGLSAGSARSKQTVAKNNSPKNVETFSHSVSSTGQKGATQEARLETALGIARAFAARFYSTEGRRDGRPVFRVGITEVKIEKNRDRKQPVGPDGMHPLIGYTVHVTCEVVGDCSAHYRALSLGRVAETVPTVSTPVIAPAPAPSLGSTRPLDPREGMRPLPAPSSRGATATGAIPSPSHPVDVHGAPRTRRGGPGAPLLSDREREAQADYFLAQLRDGEKTRGEVWSTLVSLGFDGPEIKEILNRKPSPSGYVPPLAPAPAPTPAPKAPAQVADSVPEGEETEEICPECEEAFLLRDENGYLPCPACGTEFDDVPEEDTGIELCGACGGEMLSDDDGNSYCAECDPLPTSEEVAIEEDPEEEEQNALIRMREVRVPRVGGVIRPTPPRAAPAPTPVGPDTAALAAMLAALQKQIADLQSSKSPEPKGRTKMPKVEVEEVAEVAETPAPAKRGPGRPKKTEEAPAPATAKRGPGRPPKSAPAVQEPTPAKRGPGRPPKAPSVAQVAPVKATVKKGPAPATKAPVANGNGEVFSDRVPLRASVIRALRELGASNAMRAATKEALAEHIGCDLKQINHVCYKDGVLALGNYIGLIRPDGSREISVYLGAASKGVRV